MAPEASIPNSTRFLLGGLSGVGAVCFTQPLDLVKNRMQMSGEGGAAKQYKNTFHTAYMVVREEGLLAIYNGLSAGALRQATYTTTRLGIYTLLFDKFAKDGKNPSFAVKAGLGVIAGAVAACVGNPAEVALVRMCLDGKLPPAARRNYSNAIQAIYKIGASEGVTTLWRGCTPTVLRAMVVNAAQLATYSQSKQMLIESGWFKDNILCHFAGSMISGFVTTAVSMPVDIAKTRIQNMQVIDGKPEYRNAFDVWSRVINKEGIFALWKGFTPSYLRIGPHTVLMFIFLEKLTSLYSVYVLHTDSKKSLL